MQDAPEPNDPWLGRILGGDFRITRALGEGGFGAVYFAEQLSVRREVVVKVIKRSLTESERIVERFRRESQIVARLNHPNVVQVHTAGETDDGAHYLVMEYVRGPTLHELLHHERQLDEVRALRICEQIAAALAAAHAVGIVHRDLKPANVVITAVAGRDELVKVLDFGIAKLLDRDESEESGGAVTETGAIIGTPAYMSPEQVSGEQLDGRSDIYTLGLIFYEMLTGSHPFDAKTPVQFIIQHLQEPITPPSIRAPGLRVSAQGEAILQRCLAKDRGERFPSAEALQIALKRAGDRLESAIDPATHAQPRGAHGAVPMAAPTADADHRRAVLTAAVMLGLIILAGVGIGAMLMMNEPASPSGPGAEAVAAGGERVSGPDDPERGAGRGLAPAADDDEKPAPGASLAGSPAAPAHAAPPQIAAPAKPASRLTANVRRNTPPARSVPLRNTNRVSPTAAAPMRMTPTGPFNELLPNGAQVRMSTQSLVSYSVPYAVPEVGAAYRTHFSSLGGVMFNDAELNSPRDPFFSAILGREVGVTMVSVLADGANRSIVNFFVTQVDQ